VFQRHFARAECRDLGHNCLDRLDKTKTKSVSRLLARLEELGAVVEVRRRVVARGRRSTSGTDLAGLREPVLVALETAAPPRTRSTGAPRCPQATRRLLRSPGGVTPPTWRTRLEERSRRTQVSP